MAVGEEHLAFRYKCGNKTHALDELCNILAVCTIRNDDPNVVLSLASRTLYEFSYRRAHVQNPLDYGLQSYSKISFKMSIQISVWISKDISNTYFCRSGIRVYNSEKWGQISYWAHFIKLTVAVVGLYLPGMNSKVVKEGHYASTQSKTYFAHYIDRHLESFPFLYLKYHIAIHEPLISYACCNTKAQSTYRVCSCYDIASI